MANHSKRQHPAAPAQPQQPTVRKTLASEFAELKANCPIELDAMQWASLERMFYSGAVSCFAILITDTSEPNAGNYEPGNCKWSTHSEQMLNRRMPPPGCSCGTCRRCKNREAVKQYRTRKRGY